jgi:isoleucyl-tRNA synthetase
MFKPVSSKLNVNAMELAILEFWKKEKIFQTSTKNREGKPEYVFYEGPPTANGMPGVHHVLARVFKDIFPRYKTMQGFHVSRRGGWDTHGLPVEIEVEKKLGFKNKQQIEEYGIAKFNRLCRESAFSNIQEWEKLTERIAYWVDFDTAYITYKNSYIESVWSILNNFWNKDLLYQGFKVVPYCPRCGTPLSDHEVALGYKDVTEPSIFVRMPLADDPDTSLLVWTTTPWTLPGNVAIAVHPDITYVVIKREVRNGVVEGTEKLILAESLLEKVFGEEDVEIVEKFKGKHLKGWQYKPLYTFLPPDKPAHRIVFGDFVNIEEGTGLVHIAPAFGADDMQVSFDEDLPILMTVAPNGTFIPEVRPWSGRFVKDADPFIIEDLKNRGLLYKVKDYSHSYPFCWRCATPLLYYARPTWYIRTSQLKEKLVSLNQEINWYPDHIKDGRFGNWLANNIDWALGRERYWGTPLPVWECTGCGHQECIGSVKELSEKTGKDLTGLDLHRPYVDEIVFPCSKCGEAANRVPELIDVWFDSGSMPYAQWHYPFEDEQIFTDQYPADYICEAVDQTRGWFYSLHAISTLLFGKPAFKNVICLGLILDGEGRKMSKSKGNVVDPWEVLDAQGADAMRWYLYTASPPGQERRFSAGLVSEVLRSFTLTLWNTYSFFVTYANLDGWKPDPKKKAEYSKLDLWVLAELHKLVRDVTYALENYDVLGATRPIEGFVNNLSNWYLRRSRRRFWKSESDDDKYAAYATLYEALVTVSQLLAPSMPFISEEIYSNLVKKVDLEAPISIHTSDWPEFKEEYINQPLIDDMNLVMKLVSLGHAARNQSGIKVRQPLQEAAFTTSNISEGDAIQEYSDLLKNELNVKNVRSLSAVSEAAAYEIMPLPKQLGQKYKKEFPSIRKAILDLDADDFAKDILDGKSVPVISNGKEYLISPDEVEVRMQAKEGFVVASEGALIAALITELTPELWKEGLAREFVRRVQEARKQAEFDISDRIKLFYTASKGLAEAIEEFKDYIMLETLSVEIVTEQNPETLPNASDEFDGETLALWLLKEK